MPRSEIVGVTVSHVWDDDSRTNYRIERGEGDEGVFVTLSDGEDSIRIHKESWSKIQGNIELLICENAAEND